MGNHSVKSVVKKGDMEQVKEYFDQCPDMLTHQDRYGWTPPHLAVHYHRKDVLKYLLEETTADVNHVDNEGSTLLHHAMYFCDNHFEVVEYLLQSGRMRFSNIKDHHGYTALHLAFKLCSLKQIEMIMDNFKGLKDAFNEKNRDDKTPLDLLKDRVKGNKESLHIVEELQKHIERKAEGGPTPSSSHHGSPASTSAHASGHSTPKGRASGHSTPHLSSRDHHGSGSSNSLKVSSTRKSNRSSRQHSDDESDGAHHKRSSKSSRQTSDDESDHTNSHNASRGSGLHHSTHHHKSSSHKKSNRSSRKPSDDEAEESNPKSPSPSSEKRKTSHDAGSKKTKKKSSKRPSRQHSDDESDNSNKH